MVSQDDIRRIVDTILERFHPEKVTLFGSYARGHATPDTDVRFCREPLAASAG